MVFRVGVGGSMGTEIKYGEFNAFHSNRQAEALETGDRH